MRSRQTSSWRSGNLRQRHDPRRVDDGRVEPGLHALVQEHRVQDVAGGRREAERHVRQAEDGVDAGQLGLDAPDALDGLDAVPPALLHAGRQRQGQGVEEQVARLQAVAVDGQVVDGLGRPHLPVGRAGLALLVDARRHHGGAVLPGQSEEPVEAGAGGVAVLQVHRVEDGLAADPLQAGLDDLGLGGVEHQRDAGLGGEADGDLVHVLHAVLTRVVDADVEDVGALLHLVPRHGHARVPVAGQHGVAELLGPVGVRPLPHHEERRVLVERDGRVDRRGAGLPRGVAPGRLQVLAAVDDRLEVLGARPAAAADHVHAQLGDEPGVVLGQLVGREVVVHLPVDHRRQAGVGQAGDRYPAVLGEVAQMLVHLGGTGGAVDADDVGAKCVEGDQGGADLGAGEHAAGQLDRHLDLERYLSAYGGHGAAAGDECGFGLQEVEDGLDEEEVDAAFQKSSRLDLVGVAELCEPNLAQRGELGARADGAGDPPAVPAGHLLGDLGGLEVQLVGAVGDPVFAEGVGQRPE